MNMLSIRSLKFDSIQTRCFKKVRDDMDMITFIDPGKQELLYVDK